jgi:outer membrane immunogenic protein
MKKIILATALAALGSTAAVAADLGERTYTKAPAVTATVSNWIGFYIGGNVGYGWANGRTNSAATTSGNTFASRTLSDENGSFSPGSKGVTGGAQIGYNWQMGSLVTGFEADIQGSGIKGSVNQSTLHPDPLFPAVIDGSAHNVNEKLSWFGTARGRLGATVTPDLMLYGTGGLAYGRVSNSANTNLIDNDGPGTPMSFPASVSRVKAGWAAGAGGEWMFARNWSAKVEYIHVDLGKVSAIGNATPATDLFFSGSAINYVWRSQENLVRAGVNYRFN